MSPSEGAEVGARLGGRLGGPAGALLGAGVGYTAAGGFGPSKGNEPTGAGRGGAGGSSGPRGNLTLGKDYLNKPGATAGDPATPPNPQNSREELDEAAADEERRQSKLRGRASTILTGGRGLLSPPSKVQTRTLLGS